jgi:hypothetical protein
MKDHVNDFNGSVDFHLYCFSLLSKMATLMVEANSILSTAVPHDLEEFMRIIVGFQLMSLCEIIG